VNVADIFIRDDLHPEDNAMIQALYSRSPARFVDHLQKVADVGSGKFMDTYYVGYNHDSIGDCGSTTIFIEGVSMLAAKAVQDWPLYKGQEASTRYMDFSKVRIENPHDTEQAEQIQERWMAFYHRVVETLPVHIRTRYPRREGEDEKQYERAIKARVFDIARGFIPAGATTNLSWHGDLRQMRDHLEWMRNHPDEEIGILAENIIDALRARYPNSGFGKRYAQTEAWQKQTTLEHYFLEAPRPAFDLFYVEIDAAYDRMYLEKHAEMLRTRPAKATLPPWFAEAGTLTSLFWLDFGSFRDLQRHRNGVVRMPLLSVAHGFHPWYLSELPDDLPLEALDLIKPQVAAIQALDIQGRDPRHMRQYYVPLGFVVPCRVTQSLPAFIYRVELRSAKTVHPTLRRIAQEEARIFAKAIGDPVVLHVDNDPDDWDIRRGKHTIEEKG